MKQCMSCKQDIHEDATRCNLCQSYQNWRRYVGDVNIVSLIALTSTVLAILTGYNQLNGVSTQITTLKNENTLLADSNVKKNEALRGLSFILEDVEGQLENNKKVSTQMEKVISLQQSHIDKLDSNVNGLTSLIERQ